MYNIPTGPSDYPTPISDNIGNSGGNSEMKAGRPSPYMVCTTNQQCFHVYGPDNSFYKQSLDISSSRKLVMCFDFCI